MQNLDSRNYVTCYCGIWCPLPQGKRVHRTTYNKHMKKNPTAWRAPNAIATPALQKLAAESSLHAKRSADATSTENVLGPASTRGASRLAREKRARLVEHDEDDDAAHGHVVRILHICCSQFAHFSTDTRPTTGPVAICRWMWTQKQTICHSEHLTKDCNSCLTIRQSRIQWQIGHQHPMLPVTVCSCVLCDERVSSLSVQMTTTSSQHSNPSRPTSMI